MSGTRPRTPRRRGRAGRERRRARGDRARGRRTTTTTAWRSTAAACSRSARSCCWRSRRCTSCCRSSRASRTRGSRIEDGSPYWMIVALLFGVGMFFGYVAMFRGIFLRAGSNRIDWRASYQITMAGLAASRIFAAGGAGGLVLTAWALRRSGMRKRLVADKTLTFLILTYIPYMAALIVCGLGPAAGDLPRRGAVRPHRRAGDHRRDPDRDRRLDRAGADRPPAPRRGLRAAATGGSARGRSGWPTCPPRPRPACATRSRHLRHPDPALVGAILFWACQVGVLWARSTRSATRRRSRSSPRRSSWGCSATCCRCRAASAAWRAG